MRTLFLILQCFLIASISHADEYFEPVTDVDQIHGCWKRILFPEKAMEEMNQFEMYPIKYQWYCFLESGELYTMHSTREKNYHEEDLLEQMKIFPSVEYYSIPRNGIIFVHHKDANQKAYWLSSLIERNFVLRDVQLRKGDMLMTIRDARTGKDVYYRFLRRIEGF